MGEFVDRNLNVEDEAKILDNLDEIGGEGCSVEEAAIAIEFHQHMMNKLDKIMKMKPS